MMTSDIPSGPQRDMRLLIAAAVMAVAVVVAVFTVGIDRPPALPLLRDVPDAAPENPIAWSSWGDTGLCVLVAETSGEVRTVTCDLDGELVEFDTDGPLTVQRRGGGMSRTPTLSVIDRDTGDVREMPGASDELNYELVREPTWFRDGNEIVVRYANRDVWRVVSRGSYTIFAGRVSPDEQHIVLADSVGRLILVDTSGAQSPTVWVDYSRSRNRSSPNMILWEGESLLNAS